MGLAETAGEFSPFNSPRRRQLALGYVVSGDSTAPGKSLVIRVAGPSLGALGQAGSAADPKLEIFAGATKTGENDDWGGSPGLAAAMARVGAFGFANPGSKDAAILTNVSTTDNSVIVSDGAEQSGQRACRARRTRLGRHGPAANIATSCRVICGHCSSERPN